MVNSLRELELATRKHLRCDTIESAGFWATKSRGEPVSPLVSLPLAQSSNPVSLPPAYHHMPTMSPPTTLASLQPSYHYLATMTSATPVNQPQPSYQHMPIMASTIPANHLLSQTMSQFQTATAQSHLPVPSVYPTTTATTTNHHIISSNFTDAFNNAYKHSLYTAEPLDQPLNTQSPSIPPQLICHPIYQLMWRNVVTMKRFHLRKVIEREVVAMSKDKEVMECILPQ
ncbi:unnamed protein product [Mytilus coruscus]|uniref:Uncharacterized protein n=1 Tax=Mytilus coruscus TaxID=42192 RepID=A0A6J8C907_MYTCO|nr:unnamed protein product [Mytilus coruscus]